MISGAKLIEIERERQQLVEKYTLQHDLEHTAGQLAIASLLLLCHHTGFKLEGVDPPAPDGPWQDELVLKHEKTDDVRRLVIAGALIAAEIDRLRVLK